MTSIARVIDCLCLQVLRVESMQRVHDVTRPPDDKKWEAFAVFDEGGNFMEIVTAREAALFPNRIFADLITRRPTPFLSSKAGLRMARKRLNDENRDFLPVADDDNRYIGAISRASLFNTLLAQERRLFCERNRFIKELETKLAEHHIAQLVFDSTSEGVIVADANTIIQRVNPAFCRTTGFSAEEAIGKTPRILSSGQQSRSFYADMWRSLLTTNTWQGEIWNRRKSGEVYPEWLTINCVRNEQNEIRQFVAVFSDISSHHHLRESLHQLAYFDTLTSLPNRMLFQDRLQQAIAHSERQHTPFALLFIDIDNFKQINDALGHSFGDNVLAELGHRLQSACRQTDSAARLGGDEFAILLLDQLDENALAKTVDDILHKLCGHISISGQEIYVTCSIGVAVYPQDAATAEILLRNADTAMYRAKIEGRERSSYYKPEMSQRIYEHLVIENTLRHALEHKDFHVVWHPQIDLASGRIVGAEVLLRCECGTDTPISPAVFIPIAEKSGLISSLGDWVLETVNKKIPDLFSGLQQPFRIAINLSMLQLNDVTLRRVLALAQSLQQHHLTLEIELTESALMQTASGYEHDLQHLRNQGVDIAVDDFGTGYSNLARLIELPISRLKIDQSLLYDLREQSGQYQIISAIIAMGHALKLKILAEGVETTNQADILTRLNCDEAQGFLYHRPLQTDVFAQLLRDNKILPSE